MNHHWDIVGTSLEHQSISTSDTCLLLELWVPTILHDATRVSQSSICLVIDYQSFDDERTKRISTQLPEFASIIITFFRSILFLIEVNSLEKKKSPVPSISAHLIK